jgi:hypothetical protein
MADLLLGLDPGRSKTGWAFVKEDGTLVASGIVPADAVGTFVDALNRREVPPPQRLLEGSWPSAGQLKPGRIVLGRGTGSACVMESLSARGLSFICVDEAFSTLRARALYWRLHPPRGLLRWIPQDLRTPPRDLDDLAAWSLVRGYLDCQE